MSDELPPCPDCGGTLSEHFIKDGENYLPAVRCLDCRAVCEETMLAAWTKP